MSLKMNLHLSRTARSLFLVLLTGAAVAGAQSSPSAAGPENPVAQVRDAKSWEYGPFVNYGVGVGERSQFKFLSAGVQVGKPLSRVYMAGPLSGQFEYSANILPLWQAYTPAAHMQTFHCCGGETWTAPEGGGTYYGVSLTPVILRWNLKTSSKHFQPWVQGAGGLIYTTHKFPGVQMVPHGTPGGSSVWNFSPQGGAGVHYFTRPKRSIDLGINAVHISSASLGDKNPGVNASVQFQVGYTFWK